MAKIDNKLLSNLINNAFDFLEKAINQFENDPKYSVINFCASVELLLKARLMHEHWSLIVVSSNHPNISDFKAGNFKSINFKDLIPRIEAVTGDKINKEANIAFNNLANHRNKMIHFFHEAHSDETSKKLLEEIAIEQCNSWFYLRRLLERWDDIFSEYSEKIYEVNHSMKSHGIYLNTVFERIKPELEISKKKGTLFCTCKRCAKEASEEFKKTDHLYQYKCRVCLFQEALIKIPCTEDECQNFLAIPEAYFDDQIICNAGHEISREEIADMLDTDPVTHDNYFEHVSKNCAQCQGHSTVVQHDEYFICTDCFYVSDDISYCDWCNEGQIGGGDLEMSNYSGCEFCDGQGG